ncbi:unnamed protein product [Rhizophagus irregularis]|nr:unnamed protein product [Rhizophagus irregularis]
MSDNDFDDADYDKYESSSDFTEDVEDSGDAEDSGCCSGVGSTGRPVCCKCQKVFGKDTGISTLKRHLSSAHKIMIENVKSTLTNQSVLNFKRVDPWPEKEKSERDNAVVEWIIGDAQPFRSVKNLYFRQIVNTFDSRYQVPDKNGIKNLAMDYFEAKRDNIQYDLNNILGKISLTADGSGSHYRQSFYQQSFYRHSFYRQLFYYTVYKYHVGSEIVINTVSVDGKMGVGKMSVDIWTSTFNNDAYLGLTIHFIDNDWNLRNFLLDLMSFTTRHTGINIADAIISILRKFHILEKTLALTTDNESAMIVCGRTIAAELADELNNQSFRHYRCSAHILNLAAQQGIKIIDNEIVKIHNLQYYKPQLDVETQWNSTYYMIVKFQKILRPIEMLAAIDQSIGNLMPDAEGWMKIKDTLILLEPLEKATVLLSASSYPTISDIRFLFFGIQQHLDDYIGEEGFSQSEVASSILEKIKQYWEVVDSSTIVATILDPRTKLTLFATGEESTNAVNAIKSHFAEYNVSPLLTSLPNTNQETVSNQRSVRRSRSSGIYEELDRYLALPCDDNVEPLLWWKAHFREFPALGAMARDYLSIQATSVPCEQAFSVASNTITRTRNRMLLETARALLCSKSWLEKGIGSSRKGKIIFEKINSFVVLCVKKINVA